ncbi:MAG: DEAD/DEAH box helicase [Candidatus Micrarchaeota archaeon]|nr:DEAD/DEAH box helicase [Candidatus Micrarchaeota archaeon]MBU1681831.1 DEAD/DEAH box helicase [Candidatus Micrarchaeota archaeon]
MKFSDLKLNRKTLEALEKLGYEEPTEVQEKAVPEIMEGHNLIIRSQTGTGKTAAFGIGIIERIASGSSKKGLVLTPTRELALQVCKELQAISLMHRMKVFAVYGGHSITVQIRDLKGGVDILVATPGRLLDLNRRGVVSIKDFDTIILDEADHMLDMGFADEMTDILAQLPDQKTMLLLSATIDESILNIASKYIPKAKTIEIGEIEVVATITEEHVETIRREKFSELLRVLKSHRGIKTIIFMETKRGTMWLEEKLSFKGFKNVDMLQGDMSQSRRNAVLSRFKEGKVDILVATNVAARGLHIDEVGLIINYDKAESEETHLHRVGRTGRMGAEGKVVNFVQRVETVKERHADDHPDFAWMKHGIEHTPRERPTRDSGRRPSRTGARHPVRGKKPYRKKRE